MGWFHTQVWWSRIGKCISTVDIPSEEHTSFPSFENECQKEQPPPQLAVKIGGNSAHQGETEGS